MLRNDGLLNRQNNILEDACNTSSDICTITPSAVRECTGCGKEVDP